MAIIYWKLGHLSAQGFQRPLDAFLIFRDGLVFDVDSQGWDRGIRHGERLTEMKWRYPGAIWVPWQARHYERSLATLHEWLRDHAVAYQQQDIREGWWEWPRITEHDWRRLLDDVVPRWAQRLEAGVASHPWVAHWIAEEGEQLRLPSWRSSLWRTYILHPTKEDSFWPRLPLRYVEGVSTTTRQLWHKRRWKCVADVPGLLSQVRSLDVVSKSLDRVEKVLTRQFDELITEGIGEVMRDLARELNDDCRAKNQGVRFLRVTWSGELGTERREREWPNVKGDAKSVVARVLSLLNYPPTHPFDRVALEARTEAVESVQLEWWQQEKKRPAIPPTLSELARFSPSRRELLLTQWDLWRMAGDRSR